MFDVGFAELLLIAVVALLVLGPERMPQAVRSMYRWSAQLRRSFGELKRDFEHELNTSELKQELHNSAIMQQLADSATDLNQDLTKVKEALTDLPYDIQGEAADQKPRPEAGE